ncbi:MAG: protoporphyrinogen oxidase [Candidatus Hydrogenedentota bacterium]
MHYDTKIAILGGGVTGLCAAHYLAERYGRDAVLLLEASDYPGGTTRTDAADGFLLDWGPNGFLDREPLTLQWVDDLGLSDKLVRADESAARRFIMKNDALVEILPPPKFLLTPLLSLPGRARLMCEPLVPGKKDDSPETIWDFAARRIGKEAADTLVGPMVSGVFGGDAKQLSLAHCFPRMAAMERDYGTLFKALLAKKKENNAASPVGPSGVLTSFEEGIGYLPTQAAEQLNDRALAGTPAKTLSRDGGAYRIACEDGTSVDAQAVVLATPAFAAANIVNDLNTALAKTLDAVAYANIAVVCTAFPREAVGHDLNGFGFLIPRTQGKRILGCLWTSSIFPHQAPEGHVLLRTMIGGYTDPDAVEMSDSDFVDLLRRELYPLLRIEGEPEMLRIFRHRRGIPQYLLHHGETLAVVEAAEATYPGLVFAGNAYRGVGLNDCVVSAHRAVNQVAASLG